jgi:hypothetical protein
VDRAEYVTSSGVWPNLPHNYFALAVDGYLALTATAARESARRSRSCFRPEDFETTRSLSGGRWAPVAEAFKRRSVRRYSP